MSYNFIALETPEQLADTKRLIEFVETITVDKLNEVGSRSGFAGDVVKHIKKAAVTMTFEEGQQLIIANVYFTDKDGNAEGEAFVFINKDNEIYLDFPY